MEVATKTLQPVIFQKHIVNRLHAKKKAKRVLVASLSLTSMVDMFSLLVIFLLQSFSTSPELIVSKGIQLPQASTGAQLLDAPVMAVDGESIFLDQKKVGAMKDLINDPAALLDGLKGLREAWQKTHPNQEFKGELNFQAHKSVPGSTIAKIMGFLPTENYSVVQLIVVNGR